MGANRPHPTIRAHVWDAHTLPFADDSFDAVTFQFASRHLEIKERLTAPGYCYTGYACSITRIIAFFSSRKSRSSYPYKL
ncbi:MAG: class I SAM-dependent methyltransferase [Alphaproteobacteria bacterium]|nr:MAG: class I SAM-dependent methyltransferase [Alphaproteobacteria bacterium]TMJ47056.1 MAG: class I SAM-dependent methyltransferase [Alphaproteobacteria bacterium]